MTSKRPGKLSHVAPDGTALLATAVQALQVVPFAEVRVSILRVVPVGVVAVQERAPQLTAPASLMHEVNVRAPGV